MKLKLIINFFGNKSEEEPIERLGNRVFKKITDFKRKVEIIPSIYRIRDICKEYEISRNDKITELIQDYCDKENHKNKDNKDYTPIKPYPGMTLPEEKLQEYYTWFMRSMDTDIDVDIPKFKPEEIELADKEKVIDIEELLEFKDFFDMDEMKEYVNINSKKE